MKRFLRSKTAERKKMFKVWTGSSSLQPYCTALVLGELSIRAIAHQRHRIPLTPSTTKKKKSGRTKCLFKRCRPLKHNLEAAFSRHPKIVRTTRRFLCAQILKNIVYNPSCQQRPYHTILCNNFWFCTRLHHQSQHTYDQRPKNIFMKTGQGTP